MCKQTAVNSLIDALGLLLTAFVVITILSILVASVTYLVFAP
jgi:hypothetical protein